MRNREVLRQFQRIWMYMEVCQKYVRFLEGTIMYLEGICMYIKT
jgi:hypothetical protein